MVTDPRIEERYTADGIMDVFDVTIDHVQDQLAIFLIDLSDVWTEQAKGIDWEYVDPDQILFKIAPPTSGYQVVIQTNAEKTQELDLIQNDPLPPDELEGALDKLTILARQAENRAVGALTYPDYTTGPYYLPAGGARANRILSHDSVGDAVMLLPSEFRDALLEWQGGITYTVGSFVTLSGRLWSASVENTDSPPAAGSTDWKLVTTDFITDNMWQNDIDYPVGTIIAHTNASLFVPLPAVPALWVAISPVVGSQPGDDPSQWELFAVPPAHQLRWSSDVTYEAGIVVMHNNRMWLASSNSKDIEPGTNDAAWLPHSDRGTASVSDDYTYDQDYRAFTLFVDTTTNPAPVITLSDPTLTDREVKVVVYGGGEANVVGTGINTTVKSDSAAEFIWTGTAWIALSGGGGGAGLEVGETTWWPGAGNLPSGKLELDGTLQSISEYPALFGKLGTTWGGDGITTFGLPDLQGIFPGAIGVQGTHGDAGWNVGDIIEDSFESHFHTMPSHRHIDPTNNTHSDNNAWGSTNAGLGVAKGSSPSNYTAYTDKYGWTSTVDPGDTNPTGGDETRPASAMGRWIIQAAPSAPSEVNAVVVDVEISDVRWSPAITVGPNDMVCDGSVLAIQDYPELYLRIGETFPGGDGSTTFALPNLQGITPGAFGTQDVNGHTKGDGTAIGGVREDSMQRIYGRLRSSGVRSVLPNDTAGIGAFALGGGQAVNSAGNSGSPEFPNDLYFDSANSTVDDGARTGFYTRSTELVGNWIIRVTQPASYVVPGPEEMVALISDLLHPVGMTFMQLAGSPSPVDMAWQGTWDDVSATYAGLFFRAEGGNAEVFEGGNQSDVIRNITGALNAFIANSCASFASGSAAFSIASNPGAAPSYADRGAGVTYSRANFSASGSVPTGPENRPVNTTVRIWKRTA